MNTDFDLRLIDAASIRADLFTVAPFRVYLDCQDNKYFIDVKEADLTLKNGSDFLSVQLACHPIEPNEPSTKKLQLHCDFSSNFFRSAKATIWFGLDRYYLDNASDQEKAMRSLKMGWHQLQGLLMISKAVNTVVNEIVAKASGEEYDINPLNRIKYQSLSPIKMLHRHLDMSSWANSAKAHYQDLSDKRKPQVENMIIKALGKTSAVEAFKLVEEISLLLDMQNPLALYCTQKKLSGLSGIEILTIKHVIAICLIGILPDDGNITNAKTVKLTVNYFGWEKIREEHDKMLELSDSLWFKFSALSQGNKELAKEEILAIKEISMKCGSIDLMKLHGKKLMEILNLKNDIFCDRLPKGDKYPSENKQKVNSLFHFLF